MATFTSNHGYLRVNFRWQGKRYRLGLGLRDTRDNRRVKKQWLIELNVALKKESFRIEDWFEGGRVAPKQEAPLRLLGAYARQWLEHQPVGPAGRYDYESQFRVFLDRTPLGMMQVASVTKHDIQSAIKGKSSDRAIRFLQRLRSVLDDAVDDSLLAANPAMRVKNPKRDARREPVEPFDRAEQILLRTTSNRRDRWIVTIALGTGMRPSEILRIQRGDIDLKRRRLLVRGTKTEGSARVVEPSPSAMLVLEEIVAANIIGPIFAGTGWTHWRCWTWKHLLAEKGIRYRYPYAMKHTCVIGWLEEGRDPVWVAKQLGHSNTQMIHRHYARWINKYDEKAMGL